MTQEQHPITPTPELVQQWWEETQTEKPERWVGHLATRAARWGADQELEACCQHLRNYQWGFVGRPDGSKVHTAVDLQLARRPKPPSLKELALEALSRMDQLPTSEDQSIILRALESLPD